MKSSTEARFWVFYRQLPEPIRKQAREAYRRFMEHPFHPSLQFKQVHTTKPIYSVRINLDYRALGVRDQDEIIWFWIGTHAEYDRLLKRF